MIVEKCYADHMKFGKDWHNSRVTDILLFGFILIYRKIVQYGI